MVGGCGGWVWLVGVVVGEMAIGVMAGVMTAVMTGFNPIPGGVENIRFLVGGAFKAPPMFSLKLTFLGPKNDKTIYPHKFEDLMEGSEPKHPPLAPQKTYFFATPQKMLKFRNFQKSRFFGGPEGGVLVSKHPKLFSISILINLGG